MSKNITINRVNLIGDNEEKFTIARITNIHQDLITRAVTQAQLKSQHTMNVNQNNQKRSSYQKFNKQFQGIISEIVCTEFLNILFQNGGQVIRYDDVRTDKFKSPNNEYDTKIITENKKEFEIEIRSSLSYKHSMDYNNLNKFDVIGPYTNQAKKHEAYNNLYMRPILQLKNSSPAINLKNIDVYDLFNKNELEIYITGGCDINMMKNHSIVKSMGQKNTKYQVVPVLKSMDMVDFTNHLRDIKNNNKLTNSIKRKNNF